MKRTIHTISSGDIVWFAGLFVVILLSAKFGQFIFFELNTSPAVLWPPTGIGIAVMWLRGYRFAIPIFLALSVSTASGPTGFTLATLILIPLAQIVGQLVAVYGLKKFGLDDTFTSVRSVVTFFTVVVFASMFTPTLTTAVFILTDTLTAHPYLVWSRSWAGHIFSSFILFPVIVRWVLRSRTPYTFTNSIELLSLLVLISTSMLLLSWYPLLSARFPFFIFSLFFIVYFWICLRFSVRILASAFLLLTVFGSLGLFFVPNSTEALNVRLFTAELFLLLVIPVFYLFSALVKDRARTIEKLQKLMKKYEDDDVAKSNFISILAHELRNPLAPVKTTLEILKIQESDPETKTLITDAEKQVHSMRRILDDLLDLTRVTQGKFQLKLEEVHLCSMITHCVDAVLSQFRDRNHTITIEPRCDESLWLTVDPVRIEQVIVNVLNNAAKYTPAGGLIRITVATRGQYVDIRIIDNGIGIKRENIDDIFLPFWQSTEAMSDGASGIGVGLSLTRHIVEMHHGTIHAYSAGLEKGTAITISLPHYMRKQNTLNEDEKVDVAVTLPSHRILVVDDNVAATNSLVKLLTLTGHVVDTSYTGEEALLKIRTFGPEVVLLDIGLPDMNGYVVAKQLRTEGYTGILIALSGYGQNEDKEMSLKAGFNFHITKPMKLQQLESFLQGYSTNR